MNKQIKDILSQIVEIIRQDKEQKKLKEQKGDSFNIFEICNLNNKENIHTAFIAELLNPNGCHGFGDKFLRAFINTVDCLKEQWDFNTIDAKITIEYDTGTINKSHTTGGRIDLLIESNDKMIAIENKIYAPDQLAQLFRYKKYIERKVQADNYKLLYLTLYNDEPSEYSTRNKLKVDNDYYTISYSDDIIRWLEICQRKAIKNTHVHSIISQYINTIKELTHKDMESENIDNILDIMVATKENVAAISAINKHIREWKNKTVEKYLIPQLKKWAAKNNLSFEEYNFTTNTKWNGHGFCFYKKEWTRCAIWIYSYREKWKDFYIDIESRDGKTLRGLCNKHKIFHENADAKSPYGWEYLDKYRNWTIDTMVDIANGKVGKYIIKRTEKVLADITNQNIENDLL